MNPIHDDVRFVRMQKYIRGIPTLTNGVQARSTDTVSICCSACGDCFESLDHGPFEKECIECGKVAVFKRPEPLKREDKAMLWAIVTSLSIIAITVSLIISGSEP